MSRSLLLAFEQRIVRDALRALIETRRMGHVVGECADGWEAVELAKRLRPDAVVMDFWLPQLSAVDAARRIAAEAPASRVVVIALRDPGAHVESAVRAGASACMTSDSTAEELQAALEAAGRGRCYLSPAIAGTIVEALSRPDRELGSSADRLTAREREVLQLVAEGWSTKEAAAKLGISARTAESYRASLMGKLGIHKASELVRFAIREGVIAP
jgi:DNA-binding NarL/FixJ family response regulator